MPLPSSMGTGAAGIVHSRVSDKQADSSKRRVANGYGGLKRWLSMKRINVAYQNSASDEDGARHLPSHAAKLHLEPTGQLSTQRQNIGANGAHGNDYGDAHAKHIGRAGSNLARASLPALFCISPSQNRAENAIGINGAPPLLSLLHHQPSASQPDLACLPAPPPTVDMGDGACWRPEAGAGKGHDLTLELVEQTSGKREAQEARPQPPRRKRSLIYAMYCTAKVDEVPALASMQATAGAPFQVADEATAYCAPSPQKRTTPPWVCSLSSVDAAGNTSTAFVSCRSEQSTPSSPEVGHRGETEVAELLATDSVAPHASSLPVEYMLMGAPSRHQPNERNKKRLSAVTSITGSADCVSCASSNRSSCAEHSLIEAAAYRCNSRFAPCLSTIERGTDGRLLITPNSNALSLPATQNCAKDAGNASHKLDSGNVSLKGNSPQQESQNAGNFVQAADCAAMPGSLQRMCRTDDMSVETFPPVPASSPLQDSRSDAAHSPGHLALVHPLSTGVSTELAQECYASLDHDRHSPMDSPAIPESMAANASIDTTETTKADSVKAPPGLTEQATAVGATVACDLAESHKQPQSIDMPTESDSSLPNTITASKDEDPKPAHHFKDDESLWTNPARAQSCASGRDLGLLPLADTQERAAVSPSSHCSRLYNRSEESIGRWRAAGGSNRDSRILSIFSDISDCDVTPQDLAHALPEHSSRLLFGHHTSMLFDGQYEEFTDMKALPAQSLVDVRNIPHHAGAVPGTQSARDAAGQSSSAAFGYEDDTDECDDNMALSDIVAITGAIISPPLPLPPGTALAQQPAKPDSARSPIGLPTSSSSSSADNRKASFTSRTRKLTAALVRGTPLDGLRSLHNKIKTTSNRSSSRSGSGSGSSASDEAKKSAPRHHHQQRRDPGASSPRQNKAFRFNELVAVYETWDREEYDRKGVPSTRLDAELIEQIKQELNEFKVYEMLVHDDSRCNTHFIY
ncbi:bud neck involved protein [Coemansia thaxteri]|uniref:Bud neck involved protein n=1 Tax=Coemansia thaxteri TaxID=2663907 RepID=A0A9W8BGB2_9FUNG|nr:bud neck involved protein [Coemansia thaxteri]